jgi:hypothetical protein
MSRFAKTNLFLRGADQGFPDTLLLDDLVAESISCAGQDMYYVPRTVVNYDETYTTDDQSSYTRAISIPIYIESYDKFDGDGSFMSKFSLEIRNQAQFAVSRSVFGELVTTVTGQVRPNEGDLVYFPLNRKCFQIKFVDKFDVFYPLGGLYVWKMTVELFEYANETISTGIREIDSVAKDYSTDVLKYALLDQDGNPVLNENGDYVVLGWDPEAQAGVGENDSIEDNAQPFIDWSADNPYGIAEE